MKPTAWPPAPLPTAHQSSTEHTNSDDDDDDSDESDEADALYQPDFLFPDMSTAAHSLSQLPLPSERAASASSREADTLLQPNFCFLSSSSSSDDNDSVLFAPPAPVTLTRTKRPPRSIVGTTSSFILGDKLGEGAHAIVKEGIDERSLRIVAVKILDLRRLRRLRGGLDAIDREVAVQKRLKRHPNLIELIDVIRQKPSTSKTKMYIILEMANGCTVQELVDSAPNKQLVESQVANIVYQTLIGLQYMHGKGVVHRDVKPSNLMLAASGVLKISDFGVAEFLDEYNSEDNVSRTSGSPAFQAPEIARGEHGYSGMKVDVWALGVTIYLLVGGRIPFHGESLVGLFAAIEEGKYEALENVSEDCCNVISRMLTVSWKDRASVDELLKHGWVTRGAVELSSEEQEMNGWIKIPKKEFGILDVVKRMYVADDDVTHGADGKRPQENPTMSSDNTRLQRDKDGNLCNLV